MVGPASMGIFLSYRREDTRHVAGRLFDRLAERYGSANVFMDVDSIEPGLDFGETIERAVGRCEVLVALIGEQWLGAADERGRRRLDDPDDLVVMEVVAALERRIRVIPLLIDGAEAPRRVDLPAALAPLARRNALRIDHETFRSDVGPLLEVLDRALHAAAPEAVAGADGLAASGLAELPALTEAGDSDGGSQPAPDADRPSTAAAVALVQPAREVAGTDGGGTGPGGPAGSRAEPASVRRPDLSVVLLVLAIALTAASAAVHTTDVGLGLRIAALGSVGLGLVMLFLERGRQRGWVRYVGANLGWLLLSALASTVLGVAPLVAVPLQLLALLIGVVVNAVAGVRGIRGLVRRYRGPTAHEPVDPGAAEDHVAPTRLPSFELPRWGCAFLGAAYICFGAIYTQPAEVTSAAAWTAAGMATAGVVAVLIERRRNRTWVVAVAVCCVLVAALGFVVAITHDVLTVLTVPGYAFLAATNLVVFALHVDPLRPRRVDRPPRYGLLLTWSGTAAVVLVTTFAYVAAGSSNVATFQGTLLISGIALFVAAAKRAS